jgi:hypothetical protein
MSDEAEKSMVERVAAAIQANCLAGGHKIRFTGNMAEHLARAAIAAMREPTQGMRAVAIDESNATDCSFVWDAMIDEALK